jgi:hypothetical protein
MNSLTTAINTCISQAIDELADRIASQFSIEKSEILSLWNDNVESSIAVSETAKSTPAPKKPSVPRKKTASSSDDKKCEHIFLKGKNPGSVCGRKVCEESTTGKYCKNHLVNETKSEETTKKPAAPKKSVSVSKKEAKEVETPVVKQLQEEVPVYKVKLNKWRNYEHQGTGLLFDRKTSEVYGRQQADGSVAALTADDILTCKKLGVSFRMPENITSNEEEKQEEEEEVELEEEEEEVEEEEEDN